MQHGNQAHRSSAIGLDGTLASRLGAAAANRVTPRRASEDDDRVRMVRVMMEAVDKMMGRMGILPEPA